MIRRITLTPSANVLSGRWSDSDMVLVFCDATNGAFSVSLPDANNLQNVELLFIKTDSSTNAVALETVRDQTINGSSSESLAEQYAAVRLYSDLSNYLKGHVKYTDAEALAVIQADTYLNRKGFSISIVASDTAAETGDGTEAFTVPAEWNGKEIKSVVVSVHDKGVTGTLDVQLRRRRAGADVDVLSTKVTVGDEFYAADGVINTDNDDLQTGDRLYLDIDAIHSGTAPNGVGATVMAG